MSSAAVTLYFTLSPAAVTFFFTLSSAAVTFYYMYSVVCCRCCSREHGLRAEGAVELYRAAYQRRGAAGRRAREHAPTGRHAPARLCKL